jgi:hypothetical protein
VPGYKRVEANTKRRWKKGVEAEVEKLVGKEKAYEKKLVSFTVVEKLAGEAAIANLVEKPKGEAVLAPLSAKGAALPPDFQALDSGINELLD